MESRKAKTRRDCPIRRGRTIQLPHPKKSILEIIDLTARYLNHALPDQYAKQHFKLGILHGTWQNMEKFQWWKTLSLQIIQCGLDEAR
jgi:hypothetical protein